MTCNRPMASPLRPVRRSNPISNSPRSQGKPTIDRSGGVDAEREDAFVAVATTPRQELGQKSTRANECRMRSEAATGELADRCGQALTGASTSARQATARRGGCRWRLGGTLSSRLASCEAGNDGSTRPQRPQRRRQLAMNVPIEVVRRMESATRRSRVGAALAAVGTLAIGVRGLGVTATLSTLVLVAATLTVVFGSQRLWFAWNRRNQASPADDCRLTAPATYRGRVGALFVMSDRIAWTTPGSENVSYDETEVEHAWIAPVRLIGVAELRLSLTDEDDVLFNVSAPARVIERALSSQE